jgi:glycosyltransferase involved in cell wall biosynthesis
MNPNSSLLLITRFFPPESGAAAERMRAFAYYLADERPIVILTTMPSYPVFRIDRKYRWKLFVKEQGERNNITIYRFWTPQWGRGLVARTISEILFVCIGAIVSLFLPRVHKVIVSSPPFLLGLLGVWWKYIRRTPYMFDVRDLYPDALVSVTQLQDTHVLIRLLGRLERLLYRSAESLLTVSAGCVAAITERTDTSVQLIPNGIDTKRFDTSISLSPDEHALIDTIFAVDAIHIGIYAGNIGRLYDFDPVLTAAVEHPECAFIIIGDGPEKDALLERVQQQGSTNIHLHPAVPFDLVPVILKRADFGWVFLKDLDIAHTAIPNKILEYAYAQLPIWSTVQVAGIVTHPTLDAVLSEIGNVPNYSFPEEYIRENSIRKIQV